MKTSKKLILIVRAHHNGTFSATYAAKEWFNFNTLQSLMEHMLPELATLTDLSCVPTEWWTDCTGHHGKWVRLSTRTGVLSERQ